MSPLVSFRTKGGEFSTSTLVAPRKTGHLAVVRANAPACARSASRRAQTTWKVVFEGLAAVLGRVALPAHPDVVDQTPNSLITSDRIIRAGRFNQPEQVITRCRTRGSVGGSCLVGGRIDSSNPHPLGVSA